MAKTEEVKRELWSFELPAFISSDIISRAIFKTRVIEATAIHIYYYYRALAYQSKRVPKFNKEDATKIGISINKLRKAEQALKQVKAVRVGKDWIEFIDKSGILDAQILLIGVHQQANSIFDNDPEYANLKKIRAVKFI